MQELQSISLTFHKEQLSNFPTQDGQILDAKSVVGGRVHRLRHSTDASLAVESDRLTFSTAASS